MDYITRIVDSQLKFKLESKGAVWIRGPKWCGKSTTALQVAKTVIRMQDERNKEENILMAKLNPSLFLKGETPLLIDEWQVIPFIWNQIRVEVDERDEFGQFILTGSTMPKDADPCEMHSGTGRITNLLMRPMSLYESGESTGCVSISRLMESDDIVPSRCNLSLEDYAFLTARGGWPKAIRHNRKVALQQAIDYYDGLIHSEMSYADGVKRDPERVRLLLRSYARNCSTQASYSTIKDDLFVNDSDVISEDTVASYIKALKKLFIIEESEGWNPNLKSKTAIRTSNTRYFIDPSIACASLGVGPDGLLRNLKLFGLLFENLCVRDLRIYAGAMDGVVKHYRDSNDLEVDAIITFRDATWAAIEVKLGSEELIEEGARNLIKLSDNIGQGYEKPRFLMVLTASGLAYRREDGVLVVPLGCLGP